MLQIIYELYKNKIRRCVDTVLKIDLCFVCFQVCKYNFPCNKFSKRADDKSDKIPCRIWISRTCIYIQREREKDEENQPVYASNFTLIVIIQFIEYKQNIYREKKMSTENKIVLTHFIRTKQNDFLCQLCMREYFSAWCAR